MDWIIFIGFYNQKQINAQPLSKLFEAQTKCLKYYRFEIRVNCQCLVWRYNKIEYFEIATKVTLILIYYLTPILYFHSISLFLRKTGVNKGSYWCHQVGGVRGYRLFQGYKEIFGFLRDITSISFQAKQC